MICSVSSTPGSVSSNRSCDTERVWVSNSLLQSTPRCAFARGRDSHIQRSPATERTCLPDAGHFFHQEKYRQLHHKIHIWNRSYRVIDQKNHGKVRSRVTGQWRIVPRDSRSFSATVFFFGLFRRFLLFGEQQTALPCGPPSVPCDPIQVKWDTEQSSEYWWRLAFASQVARRGVRV